MVLLWQRGDYTAWEGEEGEESSSHAWIKILPGHCSHQQLFTARDSWNVQWGEEARIGKAGD